jgi:hypothetical protein
MKARGEAIAPMGNQGMDCGPGTVFADPVPNTADPAIAPRDIRQSLPATSGNLRRATLTHGADAVDAISQR